MPAKDSGLKLPRQLYLEVTNQCNLKCKGCIQYKGAWEAPRQMTLEELVRITAQVPDLERAVLHGIGEPLLNPALPDMIRHLKAHGVFVLFNSNGLLLDRMQRQLLLETGLDELRISMDAATPAGYAEMRGSDRFEQLVGNLRSLMQDLKACRLERPKVSLWYLGTQANLAELPDLVRLAAEIEIPEVYLQRLVYFQDDSGYGAARRENSLVGTDQTAAELIQACQELAARLGIQFNASGLGDPLQSVQREAGSRTPWRKCYRPQTLMYITANGSALPCCISPFATADYRALIMGNVFETSLAEVWNGPHYRNFRKNRQTLDPPTCCRACGTAWSL